MGQPRILLAGLAVDPGFPGTEGWVPAQTLKVAANQAWFEYQPARVMPPGAEIGHLRCAAVVDTLVKEFDDNGLGTEANNLAAIDSLIAYRALRWGRHIDLILTDHRSFRSRDPGNHDEINPLFEGDTLGFVPEELWAQLDAGRDYADGQPPATLTIGDKSVANYRAGEAAQTMLGAKQKAWFLERLRGAKATWKVWGNSLGTLDRRADPQNLPAGARQVEWRGLSASWRPATGAAYHERAEIFDAVRDAGITGFAIVSGDRHSFWAGCAAKALPPAAFEPVGVSFVRGSISSPGMVEANEHNLTPDDPLRPLYVAEARRRTSRSPRSTCCCTMACVRRWNTPTAATSRRRTPLSNPDLSPHLYFVDMGGHGYATVRVDASTMVTDFVCIPRPVERSPGWTAGRCAIASATKCRSGGQANDHGCGRQSWKAMPDWRCDARSFVL